MYDPRQWSFIADMNYSGSVTITDLWLWFKWLFFMPGDFVIKIFMEAPKIANFIELSYSWYGGWLSGIGSIYAWGYVFYLLLCLADSETLFGNWNT